MTRIDAPIFLLVDDSPTDAKLMRAVFDRAGFDPLLRSVQSVDEAIAYLRGDGAYADRGQFPMPTALLLDINMQGKNGFELQSWLREQTSLEPLRVFMLSASSRPADIERAYFLGADSYFVKPRNLDGLLHLVTTLVSWLKLDQFTSELRPAKPQWTG